MVLTKDEIIRIQQKHFVFPLRADQITMLSGNPHVSYKIEIDVGNSNSVAYFFNENHQYITDPDILPTAQNNSDTNRLNRDFASVKEEVKCNGNISKEELSCDQETIDENWRIHIELIHETHRYLAGITLYLSDVKDKCSYGRRYIVGWRDDRIPIYGVRGLEPEQKRLLDAIGFLECQHGELGRIFMQCESVSKDIRSLFQEESFQTILANSEPDIAYPFACGIEELNGCFTGTIDQKLRYDIQHISSDFKIHLDYLEQVVQAANRGLRYTVNMQIYLQREKSFCIYSGFQKDAIGLFGEYEKHFIKICRTLEDIIRAMEALLRAEDTQKMEKYGKIPTQCLYGCPTAKIFCDSDVLRTGRVEIVEYE